MEHTRFVALDRRLLVANFGLEVDSHLLHYASMVARVCGPSGLFSDEQGAMSSTSEQASFGDVTTLQRVETPPRSRIAAASDRAADAEVRFLTLLPRGDDVDDDSAARSARLALRWQVDKLFRAPDATTVVNCDAVRGKTVARLLSYAVDFRSDVLLTARDGWLESQRSRLATSARCAVWMVPTSCAPVLRRILVPIDFSARGVASLRAAISLARRSPTAKCLVLHVDRHDSRGTSAEITAARQRELWAAYGEILHAVDTSGVQLEPLFTKCHNVEHSIVRVAAERSADLVVMASSGRESVFSRFNKSRAAAVLRHAESAVLLLKPDGISHGWRGALRAYWERADDPRFS